MTSLTNRGHLVRWDINQVKDARGYTVRKIKPGVIASIEVSPCGRYRYKLSRSILGTKKGAGTAMFLLMNPSKADCENYDDHIVEKGQRMARHWGMKKVFFANVCAYIASNRHVLVDVEDPAGPRNRAAILEMASECDIIVVAHGIIPEDLQVHADTIYQDLREAGHKLYYLKLGCTGIPIHITARGAVRMPGKARPRLWDVQNPSAPVVQEQPDRLQPQDQPGYDQALYR